MPDSAPQDRHASVERLRSRLAVAIARRERLIAESRRLLDEAAQRLRRADDRQGEPKPEWR